MRCQICGREMPESSKKCPTCGSKPKMVELSYAQIVEGKTPPKNNKKLILSIAALAVVLIACIGLSLLPFVTPPSLEGSGSTATGSTTSGSPWITPPEDLSGTFISVQSHIADIYLASSLSSYHSLVIVENGTLLGPMKLFFITSEQSLDGRTMTLFSNRALISSQLNAVDNDLYVVRNKQVQYVATDIIHYILSIDGSTIVYKTLSSDMINGLIAYDVLMQTYTTIMESVAEFSDYVVSPDGKTVAAISNGKLYLLQKGAHKLIGQVEGQLLSVSNDGNQIFVCNTEINTLTCYPAGYSVSYNTRSFYLNADHSQLMYSTNGSTFIYTDGIIQSISEDPLMPLLPDNTQICYNNYATTLPVYSLYDHVYFSSYNRSSLLYVGSDSIHTIGDNAMNVTYDPTHRYIYYYQKDSLLRTNLHTGNLLPEFVLSDMDTRKIEFSTDGKYLYYCKEGKLYKKDTNLSSFSSSAEGDTYIADNLQVFLVEPVFAVSNENILYFVSEGIVYWVNEQGKAETVTYQPMASSSVFDSILAGVSRLHKSANGLIYAEIESGQCFLLTKDSAAELPGTIHDYGFIDYFDSVPTIKT